MTLDYASRQRFQFVDGTGVGPYTEIEESRSLLLPRSIATARNLKVGDSVPLTGANGDLTYRVAAIVEHALPSPGGDETAVISLANGRQDFGTDGFNILQVIPASNPPAGFNGTLDDAAKKYGMQLESVNDVRAGVRRGLDQLLLLLGSVGFVGVILGLMSVVTTILLNISESGRELALLRSVGATRATGAQHHPRRVGALRPGRDAAGHGGGIAAGRADGPGRGQPRLPAGLYRSLERHRWRRFDRDRRQPDGGAAAGPARGERVRRRQPAL